MPDTESSGTSHHATTGTNVLAGDPAGCRTGQEADSGSDFRRFAGTRGQLRITAPEYAYHTVLAPYVASFQAAWPDIEHVRGAASPAPITPGNRTVAKGI